jgi:putative alpha-1,2-mannosidase
MYKKIIVFFLFSFYTGFAQTGNPADLVNVFLGSSGDHGQMSPSASYPFSMISLGPQTYPHAHMGSEFQTPNQRLRIRYRVLQDEFSCGWARYDYKVAELIDVETLKD